MQVVSDRLGAIGRVTTSSGWLSTRLEEGAVHVDPTGLCWSLVDPSDSILPIVPDLLSCPKEVVPLDRFQSKYIRTKSSNETSGVHLRVRLESDQPWNALRVAGDCALAPDEHMVAIFLMRSTLENCRVLSDFPDSHSKVNPIGRHMYFDSNLCSAVAASTLRMAGMKASRNSYLRRDGTLRFRCAPRATRRGWADLSNELGEWCFFSVR